MVTHLYLAPSLLAGIASEAMDCHVAEVQLADVLRADDPVLTNMVEAIADEARQTAMGGSICVESLTRALGVHLLRRYASIKLPGPRAPARLSPSEMRRIGDYIDDHLAAPLTVAAEDIDAHKRTRPGIKTRGKDDHIQFVDRAICELYAFGHDLGDRVVLDTGRGDQVWGYSRLGRPAACGANRDQVPRQVVHSHPAR